MAEVRLSGVASRRRRRWSFAGCVFDEANWTLTVDGHRASVEAKPLELLRELLLNAGNLVSKDQLMDSIWPDLEVVEASLPTAVGKLRRALHDDRLDRPIIETVPRIGYRLAVPVMIEDLPEATAATSAFPPTAIGNTHPGQGRRATDRRPRASRLSRILPITGALIIASAAIAWGISLPQQGSTTGAARSFSQRDVRIALRKMDQDAIEKMLAAGWDPNLPLDNDRNNALSVLVENCEWDPGHEQRRMLLLARTLIDGGAHYTDHNAWGDTPYSIASAARFCGPNHPVAMMIKRLCSASVPPAGARCLADYKRDSAGKIIHQD